MVRKFNIKTVNINLYKNLGLKRVNFTKGIYSKIFNLINGNVIN